MDREEEVRKKAMGGEEAEMDDNRMNKDEKEGSMRKKMRKRRLRRRRKKKRLKKTRNGDRSKLWRRK